MSADPKPTKWIVLVPLVLFVGLAAIFAKGLYGGDPSRIPSPLVGRDAPVFKLAPLGGVAGSDGKPLPGLATADLKGPQVSVVNVWASWCGPCRQEHPLLMELAKDKSVQLAGINYKDKPSNARRFLGSLGLPYSRVGVDGDGRASVDWGVYGVPETFIIDAKGVVRFKWIGPITAEALTSKILPRIRSSQAKTE